MGADQDRGNRYRRMVGLVVLFFVGTTVGIVMGEAAVRLLLLPPGPFVEDDDLGYRLTPDWEMEVNLALITMTVRTNSQGLRDYEHGEKAPGVTRILGLGDSFTFGAGVELADTYLSRLEQDWSDTHPDRSLDVIKAGVGGYNTRQQLAFLEKYGLDYRPDLVLVGFYCNDVPDNLAHPQPVAFGYRTRGGGGLRAKMGRRLALMRYGRVKWDALKIGLLRRMQSRTDDLEDFFYGPKKRSLARLLGLKPGDEVPNETLGLFAVEVPARLREAWDVTEATFASMKKACHAQGIGVALLYIPAHFQAAPAEWEKILARYGHDPARYDLLKPNRLLAGICARLDIDLIDPTGAFQEEMRTGSTLYIRYDGHWNAAGHSLAARELAVWMENWRQ